MTQQLIGVGTVANDGTGDPLRTAFQKTNANFTDLYGGNLNFFNYIASRWYIPYGTVLSAGVNPGANSIHLTPGFVKQTLTVGTLGARIITPAAAGNIQLAIYANNAATMKPTGTALCSTASLSTTSAGSVNGTVTGVQLTPGLYWFASNADNATVTTVSVANTPDPLGSQILGDATQAISLTSTAGFIGYSTPVTFGTWGDLTAATFTSVNTATATVVQFMPSSVP